MRFLVYRNGSNAANQSMCNRMPVAIVEASDEHEAIEIAAENVTFYNNQHGEAVAEEEADGDDWNEVCHGASESPDSYYVG